MCGSPNTEAHHIYRRKQSYGHDHDDNLLPLCRKCHTVAHTKPLSDIAERYPLVMNSLIDKGWIFDEYMQKWINTELLSMGDMDE